MGAKKQEGGAVDVLAPGSTAMTFGELYRIDGWTGFAMRDVTATDTERGLALDTSTDIYYVLVPAGMAAARGDLLYWSTGAGFKSGAADLVVAGTANAVGPVAKVEEAKDANNYVGVKLITV